MGTTKTDTFGEYSPKEPRGDRCREHIEGDLEEVGREAYFASRKTVPEPGAPVRLNPARRDGRLVVIDDETGESLGLLPVELNYLAVCLEAGFAYRGAVLASATFPTPRIGVSLDAG